MKKTIILIAATIFALASCTAEIDSFQQSTSEKFTASIDQVVSTKTTLGENGLAVVWEKGESILINGCEYTADNSEAVTTFTAVGTEATANESSPKYTSIYPATLSGNVLPDVQNYKEGSLRAMPMYAAGDTKELNFKNICAVLAVTVPQSVASTVRSIEVSSSNRALSGAFTISADNVLELTSPTEVLNTMTLECGTGVEIPSAGKTFYIAIPAGVYQDLKVIVCDGSNNCTMATKSGKDITVERNKMYPISFAAQTTTENCFRFTALTDGCHLETHSYFTDWYRDELHNNPDEDEEFPNEIIDFQYSINGGNWVDSGDFISLNLNKGDVVCIKSVDAVNGFNDWGMDYECMPSPGANVFAITSGKMKVSGDIITLLNRSDKSDRSVDGNEVLENNGSAFAFLFNGCGDHLVSARDLILPDAVGYKCYYYMFAGCSALKDAPVLPATTLTGDCYKGMFNGCSSLNHIEMLATDISASGCMSDWVSGVAETGTFVKNYDATWYVVGVNGVPEGWVVKTDPEHEYVDLGLSVKWATCNVGATRPEDYGDYFAWGETATRSNYDGWSTYNWSNGAYNSLTKYSTNSSYGTADDNTDLDPEDDVAHVRWGGSWRMPTDAEFTELRENCTWTWTTSNGVKGYRVTSNKEGYTDKSIFLPAAGFRYGSNFAGAGSDGEYWSSSLDTDYPSEAWLLEFSKNSVSRSNYFRYYGQSVRPVSE